MGKTALLMWGTQGSIPHAATQEFACHNWKIQSTTTKTQHRQVNNIFRKETKAGECVCMQQCPSRKHAHVGYFKEFSRGVICKEVDRGTSGPVQYPRMVLEKSYSLLRPEGIGSKVEPRGEGAALRGAVTVARGAPSSVGPPITKPYQKPAGTGVQVMLPTPVSLQDTGQKGDWGQ